LPSPSEVAGEPRPIDAGGTLLADTGATGNNAMSDAAPRHRATTRRILTTT
jgi:hypothetical protein